VLRPYAALLFDGWGSPNGLLPADVVRLTVGQVRNWYLRPMQAAAEQSKRERGDTPALPGPLAGDPAFREFVRKYSVLGVRKAPEEWEAAYRRHTGREDRHG